VIAPKNLVLIPTDQLQGGIWIRRSNHIVDNQPINQQ